MQALSQPDAAGETTSTQAARFPVVGIGASAGGLAALEALIGRLASDGMAYVIVQHLAPGHESMLADILKRSTPMKVETVRDGVEVAVNTIYVTPPAVEVGIERGILRVGPAAEQAPRRSIDRFFRALAADRGTAAIGVVLSGAGDDGTLGLLAIKEQGGITFAQDPETAAQTSMPQSALDAGCADFCLSPTEIGDELMRLAAHPYVARRPPPKLSPEPLAELLAMVQRARGVDFTTYKPGTVTRRIERRMALRKVETIEDYRALVARDRDELDALYADLLIGVTSFFRDREPFEALKTLVFPRLFGTRSKDTPIRIWVPGCATGEEAYSIAICLLEYLADRAPAFKLKIFATDIDEEALGRARLGRYPRTIELDVSPERLQRFFTLDDRGYQASRQLRDMVVFAHHNLAQDPPFSRLDLISCRNVLIYLQAALQQRVLRYFHYALNADGFLLLGSSETAGEPSELFALLDRRLKIHVKKNAASPGALDFARTRPAEQAAPEPAAGGAPAEPRAGIGVEQLADRTVLEKFGPPGILVNEHMEVVQFRGHTAPFLRPAPGTATLHVAKLIRPELLVELRTVLGKVTADSAPVTTAPVQLDPSMPPVAVEVVPLQDPRSRQLCMLLLFREAIGGVVAEPGPGERTGGDARAEARARELERELLITREHLQSTVQELEAANQELQSSNEELQSSNEELQSSNEELETSREELQSTNEELITVNDELQTRMAQLAQSNDDLESVLAGVSMPFFIVGLDLRIRRYSAAAGKLLDLRPDDVGRPVGYLGSAMQAPGLEGVVTDVIKTVRERVQRVRCSDGRWYSLRALPYRTSDLAIRGALVELLRMPPARKADEPLELHELVSKVLSTLPHVLMLLDEHLRIVWVNKAFFDAFVVGAEVLGRPLEEVWPSRTTDPELWTALEEAATEGKPAIDRLVTHPFGRKDDRPMRFGVRYVPAEGDRPGLTLVVMEETT